MPLRSLFCAAVYTFALSLPSEMPQRAMPPFLDLTVTVPVQSEAGGQSMGRLGMVTGGWPVAEPWPLKVTLLALDKATYAEGERVVFDLELEALGSVAIPWKAGSDSRLSVEADSQRPPERSLLFALKLVNAERVTLLSGTQGASGSESRPDSLLRLARGQRARVRGEATWTTGSGSVPSEVTIGAYLVPREGDQQQNPIQSSNTVIVKTTPHR